MSDESQCGDRFDVAGVLNYRWKPCVSRCVVFNGDHAVTPTSSLLPVNPYDDGFYDEVVGMTRAGFLVPGEWSFLRVLAVIVSVMVAWGLTILAVAVWDDRRRGNVPPQP